MRCINRASRMIYDPSDSDFALILSVEKVYNHQTATFSEARVPLNDICRDEDTAPIAEVIMNVFSLNHGLSYPEHM